MTASPRLAALLALFFLSGACGLTYQVLWLRQLSLIFGVTVYAASTVLAAFMTGLAVGSLSADRLLRRTGRPLALFAMAEVLVGCLALLTPLALEGAGAVYGVVSRTAPDSFALLTLARFVCSFLVLLPPTILMGVTLPLLSASALVRESAFGSRVSALYALNTAGAVVGCLLTGMYFIGALGMRHTFWLAAAINIGVGALAWLLSLRVETATRRQHTPTAAVSAQAGRAAGRAWLALLALVAASGLASLALEIVWFRTLVQFFDATTYAFTTMLATVLGGIALGGVIGARILARERDLLSWISLTQIATGLAAVAFFSFFSWSYEEGWKTTNAMKASVLAILPAALLMGLQFPLALRAGVVHESADVDASHTVARWIGRLYAMNVAGGIAGALLGGFLLVPWLGVRRALVALSALYVVSGLALLFSHQHARSVRIPAALLVLLFMLAAPRVPDPFIAALERRHGSDLRELWRDEGAQTAVSVHGSRLRRVLFLDGLHQANDTGEMVRLHRTIGHLPMVLHPAPRDVLVIGLGGGATPGAVSQYADARVQVVELSDGVRRAASFFAHVNYNVVQQPNVRVRVDDGRNFLRMTTQRFDVITADIIQPIHAGAGNLYSREYFSLVRRALRENGVVLQWIGHRPMPQYTLIMRTFLSVFPHATLWLDGNLMVGTLAPLRLSRAAFERHLSDRRVRDALHEVGLDSFESLQAWFTAGPEEMGRFVGSGGLLTDDRPLVEYHRSLPRDDRALDMSALRGDVSALLR